MYFLVKQIIKISIIELIEGLECNWTLEQIIFWLDINNFKDILNIYKYLFLDKDKQYMGGSHRPGVKSIEQSKQGNTLKMMGANSNVIVRPLGHVNRLPSWTTDRALMAQLRSQYPAFKLVETESESGCIPLRWRADVPADENVNHISSQLAWDIAKKRGWAEKQVNMSESINQILRLNGYRVAENPDTILSYVIPPHQPDLDRARVTIDKFNYDNGTNPGDPDYKTVDNMPFSLYDNYCAGRRIILEARSREADNAITHNKQLVLSKGYTSAFLDQTILARARQKGYVRH